MQTNMKFALKILVASTVILVMGCQTAPQQPTVAAAAAPAENSSALPAGSVRYDTEDARIAKLWSSAEQSRQEGNTDLALQRLFEAIDIQPKNGLFWSRAAEIQLNNQQAALAENFAMKSNTFAGNNDALQHRNWLIIEHARGLRGDLLGVRSAHKKVQEFQYR